MAIQNGFFKSINGDRRYLAEFFTSYFASFIGNGVFPNPSTNLQVINNQNFSTIVRPGKGWINGHYLNNDDNIVINHQPPDGVLRRIDRIVFSVNLDSRSMDIYLKQGTPSTNAVAPALIRNSTLYELALADIAFNPGATSISQSNITDQRMNKALCGIVHGVVEQLDTTTLFNQYQQFLVDKGVEFDQQLAVNQQVFDDWFAQLNDILDGDVAANLANMIITHANNATPQKHIEVVSAIPQNLSNKGLLLLIDDVDNPNNAPEIPTSMVLNNKIDDLRLESMHYLNDIGIIPNLKTSIEDPNYDNLSAINQAIFSLRNTGGTVYIPNRGDVYLIDPLKFSDTGDGIVLYPKVKLISNGANLLLKNENYPKNLRFITTPNYINGAYNPNIPITNNSTIDGLILDGNVLNASKNFSVSGINAYKVNDFEVKNLEIKNLSGNTGNGYGIITWYSNSVLLENIKISVTDRQNICIWESKAILRNIQTQNSGFREPILLSTNNPPTFQASEVFAYNLKCYNTGAGTYTIRVTGDTTANIYDSIFESDGSLKCAYIPGAANFIPRVKFTNCKFINGTYGVQAEGSGEKYVTVQSCEFVGCGDAIRVAGGASKGSVKINDVTILNTIANPLTINSFPNVEVIDVRIDTFNTPNLLIANFNTAKVRGLEITNGTGLVNNTLVINGDGQLLENLSYSENVIKNNNINKVRILTKGIAIGNVGTIDSTSLNINQNNI